MLEIAVILIICLIFSLLVIRYMISTYPGNDINEGEIIPSDDDSNNCE